MSEENGEVTEHAAWTFTTERLLVDRRFRVGRPFGVEEPPAPVRKRPPGREGSRARVSREADARPR